MKLVKLCIVLIFCIYADAWVAIIPTDKSYDGDAACYTTTNSLGEFRLGETKRVSNKCIIARCDNNRNIRVTGCGSVAVEPPCEVIAGDLSKPHPQCCYEIKCPEDNKI